MVTRKDVVCYIAQILGNDYDSASSDSWNIRGFVTNKAQITTALNFRFGLHLSFHDLDYNSSDKFLNEILKRIGVVIYYCFLIVCTNPPPHA